MLEELQNKPPAMGHRELDSGIRSLLFMYILPRPAGHCHIAPHWRDSPVGAVTPVDVLQITIAFALYVGPRGAGVFSRMRI